MSIRYIIIWQKYKFTNFRIILKSIKLSKVKMVFKPQIDLFYH